ncbi:hypothetical protein AVEN_119286-1 [Araneus ventricosus]|uniref:Uncharacterized protein n=1 Tax=Araneus ventricosus TaxID=182803 RepID=A0A4Y2EHU4_ARAVE|nr:hypothetical protein AVEN_119286-1 [Araneus ventricosus]
MTAGTVRILRKPPFSPNTSGRAIPRKKARVAGVKSITLNERGWEFQCDIRTAIVFFLKKRVGRSRIDRVKNYVCVRIFIFCDTLDLTIFVPGTSYELTSGAYAGDTFFILESFKDFYLEDGDWQYLAPLNAPFESFW